MMAPLESVLSTEVSPTPRLQPGEYFEVVSYLGDPRDTRVGDRFRVDAVSEHHVYGFGAATAYAHREVRRVSA